LIESIGQEEQQDGMDMTICVIDKEQMTLQYAAANHAFYIIRKNESAYELEEFNGDKQPVGIFGSDLKPFKQYSIELKPNDVIYTFTDGYADQFGGPKGKKFKYKPLENLLLENISSDLTFQKEKLIEKFEDWKGDLEQVDDVCIIGIKL
jgi:serine phosphatase RsbU (regulator of sigma subunit)